MASKLAVYNEACRLVGERRLSSLTEARDVRYHLDDEYALVIDYCLEQGIWNFAMRSVSMTASGSITVAFGYQNAFEKPTDWVRTYQMAVNENFEPLLNDYKDEAGVWYADATPLYCRYISNDTSYGGDLAKWSPSFAFYVACRLASKIAPPISSMSAEKLDLLEKQETRARRDARSKDALNEPPLRQPSGSWVSSRLGRVQRPRSTTLGY